MSHDQPAKGQLPAVDDRRHVDKTEDGTLPSTMEQLVQSICRRFRVTRYEDRNWLNQATASVRVQYERYKEEAIQAVVEGLAVRGEVERAAFREQVKELETRISGITAYFEKLIADLQDKISKDALTDLYNLPYLLERLNQTLGLNLGPVVALAKIDLTKFKFYNDEPGLGHQVGDEILKCVAQVMLKCTRQHKDRDRLDICVRRSGDEFIIAMFGLSSDQEGYIVAQRFKNALRECNLTDILTPEQAAIIATKQPLDADVGLAFLFLRDTEQEKHIRRTFPKKIATEWIVKADLAMYEAKRFQSDKPEPIYLHIAPHEGSLLHDFDMDSTVSK